MANVIASALPPEGSSPEKFVSRSFLISSDGGKREAVPGVPGSAMFPDWSPDGKRLVFTPESQQVKREDYHASIVDLQTGAVEPVPGSEGTFSLSWSPDGEWLAGVTLKSSSPCLYSFATRKWIEFGSKPGNYPQWSRDSRYLYVMEFEPPRIVRIEVATQKVEVIREIQEFNTTGVWAPNASWMPDDEPVVLRDLATTQIYRIERDR